MSTKIRSVKNELNRLNIFMRHDREMAKILLKKDFYKIMSSLSPSFRKNFEKHMENYVNRLDSPRISKINGINFFHRLRDLESLVDVFGTRDYTLLESFAPKEGDHVIDAGAGVGEYTILASKMVGKNGKIIAIEASEEPFRYLRRNAKSSPYKNILAVRCAVSDKNGKIELFRPARTSFVDSIVKSWTGPTVRYLVKSVTVDELVRKLKIKKLDLVKLDIEGAELLALHGAKRTLSKLRPKVIIETHGEGIHGKVMGFLKKSGYKIDFEKIKFTQPFLALVYASPKD